MSMIPSFCANLNLDKNFARNLHKRYNQQEVFELAKDYENFLKNDTLTQFFIPNDEITLSSGNTNGGSFINMDIKSLEDETYRTKLFISKKCKPRFELNSLIFQTYYYLGMKYGIEPKVTESSHRYIKRVITTFVDLLKQTKD